MVMRLGDIWNCSNPACQAQILVQTESPLEGSNPRCSCGAPMKKKYSPPVFSYLDFLRVDEPILSGQISKSDERE